MNPNTIKPIELESMTAGHRSERWVLGRFRNAESLNSIIDGDKQIDRGKQMVIHEGESQTSSTKSRKRKRNAPRCTCPRRRAKTEKPPLPEGYGYVPDAPYVDENGRYSPEFTDRVAYMYCSRCDVSGDHWDPFCRNPVYDPPEKEGAAPNPYSWKYILRNFNVDEYLQKHDLSQVEPDIRYSKVVDIDYKGYKGRLPRGLAFRLAYGPSI